jgi:hypothetical protein
VRHLVIVITDLYLSSDEAQRLAAAATGSLPGFVDAGRFGERAPLAAGWREWLAHLLGRADLAGAAPASIAAAALPAAAGTRWIATPLHLSAGVAQAPLDQRGILRLPAAELAALGESFAESFASSSYRLTPLSCGEFILETPGIAPVATTEPARAAGQGLAQVLPQGAAADLRRLLAEVEMWLYAQELNEARQRRGELAVTTLWPWGGAGGVLPAQQRSGQPEWLACGADAYLDGLWHLEGRVCRALPQRLEAVIANEEAPGAVLALEVGEELRSGGHGSFAAALAALDTRFVSPALAALRRGRLERVTLIANDRRVTLRRHSGLRLWRRPAGLGSFA